VHERIVHFIEVANHSARRAAWRRRQRRRRRRRRSAKRSAKSSPGSLRRRVEDFIDCSGFVAPVIASRSPGMWDGSDRQERALARPRLEHSPVRRAGLIGKRGRSHSVPHHRRRLRRLGSWPRTSRRRPQHFLPGWMIPAAPIQPRAGRSRRRRKRPSGT